MKRQYLGDSRDSFKWDYHHFLVTELGVAELQIVWMMTPDDRSGDGKTPPDWFAGRQEIVDFCKELRLCRSPQAISRLPTTTGASYRVRLVGSEEHFVNRQRADYFTAIPPTSGVLLLDPDNGFEPERSCTRKHVSYSEVRELVERMPSDGVLSVFQHHRRKRFPEDFARITERLHSGIATGIYWHSLMFVLIAKSKVARDRVLGVNRRYVELRPRVTVLE